MPKVTTQSHKHHLKLPVDTTHFTVPLSQSHAYFHGKLPHPREGAFSLDLRSTLRKAKLKIYLFLYWVADHLRNKLFYKLWYY
jgi:hypothetical protein